MKMSDIRKYRAMSELRTAAYPVLADPVRQSLSPQLTITGRSAVMFVLTALSLISGSASAQQFTPFDEIRKKSEIFEPRPSVDTTPVTIKVVDITYRIPRNYLIFMNEIPTFKLT
jgi:hypothetical protein